MSAVPVIDMALSDDDDTRDDGKPDTKTSISFRIERSLLADMDACVRLLRLDAVKRGEEPDKIERSGVMRRFLRTGRDGLFGKVGGIPKSEEDWAKLEAAIQKTPDKTPKR